MNNFGGSALLLDRSDINTDEIIPAKYLTENTKEALKPHLLEDLLIDGVPFKDGRQSFDDISVVISRSNFGCGSSREHAVWVLEVNGINMVIAESFARIFRQNMFNCGIMAIELPREALDEIFLLEQPVDVQVDLEKQELLVNSANSSQPKIYPFNLNEFDKSLVSAGGWLAYADEKY